MTEKEVLAVFKAAKSMTVCFMAFTFRFLFVNFNKLGIDKNIPAMALLDVIANENLGYDEPLIIVNEMYQKHFVKDPLNPVARHEMGHHIAGMPLVTDEVIAALEKGLNPDLVVASAYIREEMRVNEKAGVSDEMNPALPTTADSYELSIEEFTKTLNIPSELASAFRYAGLGMFAGVVGKKIDIKKYFKDI